MRIYIIGNGVRHWPGRRNHRIYCGIGSGRHEASNSDVTVDLLPPVELTRKCACIVAFASRLHAGGRPQSGLGPLGAAPANYSLAVTATNLLPNG